MCHKDLLWYVYFTATVQFYIYFKILSSDYNVLSNFTLAFFEDSGWYEVNYTFANSFANDQLVTELQWGERYNYMYSST